MNINYRRAEEKDSRAWYEFKNMVWRDAYKDIFPEEVFVDKEKRLDEEKDKFLELLNNESTILYIAEYNNKIVGIMLGEINSGYGYFNQEYADLVALYIDPNFQGKGIGSKLRNTFERWAKEKGTSKYVIGVLKDNRKARKVYETWGGKLSEYEEDFVKLGVGYKEVFYEYYL